MPWHGEPAEGVGNEGVPKLVGMGQKNTTKGTAGLVHLPGFHFAYALLTHSQVAFLFDVPLNQPDRKLPPRKIHYMHTHTHGLRERSPRRHLPRGPVRLHCSLWLISFKHQRKGILDARPPPPPDFSDVLVQTGKALNTPLCCPPNGPPKVHTHTYTHTYRISPTTSIWGVQQSSSPQNAWFPTGSVKATGIPDYLEHLQFLSY